MGARTGVSSNFGPGSLGGLPQTEITIASLVKQVGYTTGIASCADPAVFLFKIMHCEEQLSLYVCTLRFHRSAAIGKWHLGVKPGFHPLDHGYDTFLGLPESNDYGTNIGSVA